MSKQHLEHSQMFKQIFATYRQNQDLINVGAYAMGSDPKIDESIALYPSLQLLIKQEMNEAINWQQSETKLQQTMQQPFSQVANTSMQPPVTINQMQGTL